MQRSPPGKGRDSDATWIAPYVPQGGHLLHRSSLLPFFAPVCPPFPVRFQRRLPLQGPPLFPLSVCVESTRKTVWTAVLGSKGGRPSIHFGRALVSCAHTPLVLRSCTDRDRKRREVEQVEKTDSQANKAGTERQAVPWAASCRVCPMDVRPKDARGPQAKTGCAPRDANTRVRWKRKKDTWKTNVESKCCRERTWSAKQVSNGQPLCRTGHDFEAGSDEKGRRGIRRFLKAKEVPP